MRISDWSSDVCSSDLPGLDFVIHEPAFRRRGQKARPDIRRNAGIDVTPAGLPENNVKLVTPFVVSDSIDARRNHGHHLHGIPPARRHHRRLPRPESDRLEKSAQRVLDGRRSEEHTSELQSLMRISYAVFCLKKKK